MKRRRAERQQRQHGFHFCFHFVLSFFFAGVNLSAANLRERTLSKREAEKYF